MSEELAGEERGGAGVAQAPPAIKIVVLLLALLALGGLSWMIHDLRALKEDASNVLPTPLPATRSFVHDPASQQMYYIWTGRDHRLQSTRAFERVPGWTLATLEVWRPEFGERPTSRGGYLVDMIDAEPGQRLTATLRDRAHISAASQAADAGEAHGILTAYYAGELANLHPKSARNLAVQKLEDRLEEIERRRPLTGQEIIDLIRAAQRATGEVQKREEPAP